MRFYRLHKVHEAGTSAGYEWFTNKWDAEQAFRNWIGTDEEMVCDREGTEVERIEIDTSKRGILHALNRYAKHADNG